MVSVWVRVAAFVVIVLIVLLLYVRYIQATGIFFPTREIVATPAEYGLGFENISLSTPDDKRIHGWFIPYDSAKATVLFFHGNGGNISHRLEKILILRQAAVNICIIDYRGYGNSTGKPSEGALYRDARLVYTYLCNERAIDAEHIILYGESLGAAVAIDLAKDVPVKGLIVEGGFSSGKDLGRHFYPFVPPPLLPNIFDSVTKIRTVTVAKLFIHARHDEVVPFKFAKKLYVAAPEPKQFIESSGGHNDTHVTSSQQYRQAIFDFIRRLASGGREA